MTHPPHPHEYPGREPEDEDLLGAYRIANSNLQDERDALAARVEELEALHAKDRTWIDGAVASCAKKGCATVERRLAEAERDRLRVALERAAKRECIRPVFSCEEEALRREDWCAGCICRAALAARVAALEEALGAASRALDLRKQFEARDPSAHATLDPWTVTTAEDMARSAVTEALASQEETS